jgi:hypothetical protein
MTSITTAKRSAAVGLLIIGGIALSASAQKQGQALQPQLKAPPANNTQYRISYRMQYDILESTGSFLIQDGQQSNLVDGGETPYEIATNQSGGIGVEFKKDGSVVNCIPVGAKNGKLVHLQCQFELSGVLSPVGTAKATPIRTFQYQATFSAEVGKDVVLVDGGKKRIDLRVDDATPAP